LSKQLASGLNRLTAFCLGSDNFDARDETVSLGKTQIANYTTNADQKQFGDE
jgi:hypothetical protein